MTDTRKAVGWIVGVCAVMLFITGWLLFNPQSTNALIAAMTGVFTLATVLTLAGLAALVIYLMASGKIDLKYLVAEMDGSASLSRFQMLLFTFVIAALYFLYALYTLMAAKSGQPPSICPPQTPDLAKALGTLGDAIKASSDASKLADASSAVKSATDALRAACSNSYSLPVIPNSVLYLLGISGGSYLLSKGIQAAADTSGNATSPNTSIRKNI